MCDNDSQCWFWRPFGRPGKGDFGCSNSDRRWLLWAARGLACPFGANRPYYGVDHLNMAVVPGHAPIPANSVVNVNNVQQLTGLTPQEFVDAASAAVGQQPGFFYFGPFGALSWNAFGNGGEQPRPYLRPSTSSCRPRVFGSTRPMRRART